MEFWHGVAIALISGGLVGFIEFLIRRSDEKKAKHNEILDTLKKIIERIAGIEARLDRENADDARRNILVFDDELRRHTDHSEESYNQVLSDIKYYRDFCRSHDDYENDRATSAIAHILATYQSVKNEDRFI